MACFNAASGMYQAWICRLMPLGKALRLHSEDVSLFSFCTLIYSPPSPTPHSPPTQHTPDPMYHPHQPAES